VARTFVSVVQFGYYANIRAKILVLTGGGVHGDLPESF